MLNRKPASAPGAGGTFLEVVLTLASYWWQEQDCRLDDLAALTDERSAKPRFAAELRTGVPVYSGDALRGQCRSPAHRHAVMAEWGEVLMHGAGIVVIERLFDELGVIDAATHLFEALIAEQRAQGSVAADHFAKAGANDRIWNSLQKHCLHDPENFARYYANELLAMVCEAWLGPGYQMTAQVNVVNPGGQAQSPHRDYHLGFMTPEQAKAYPAHVHALSPVLTLQGAVAHVDMPPVSGPTLYLPYSQRYAPGYLACARPEFREHFERHHVQLPLSKGDAVFFNPALFHAAGHNRSAEIRRMANLLQVSSAMGRAMEAIDRSAMSLALYPALRALLARGALSEEAADHAVAACAEGYPFPTNLDLDPPIGGLAPGSAQALMRQALREDWHEAQFADALSAQTRRRRPSPALKD
jgi:ectoine hydroxylase-related dioxygenase (phytanoyl-CoA dioxygenase family)